MTPKATKKQNQNKQTNKEKNNCFTGAMNLYFPIWEIFLIIIVPKSCKISRFLDQILTILIEKFLK